MIKTTRNNNKPAPLKFPKLMEWTNSKIDTDSMGLIVLMTGNANTPYNEGVGVVIISKGIHAIGYSSDSWNLSGFEEYQGSITLENE